MMLNRSEKLQTDQVIKQLLDNFGHSPHEKSYQDHYAAAMYVLDNFWKDKYGFTELAQESVDEFLSAFPKTSDLYGKLIEIAKEKTEIHRMIDPNADTSRGYGFIFQAALEHFDDYVDRAAIISFADNQNFLKKDDLGRLGYSVEQLNELKEIFKYCPLIQDDGDRYTWVYPIITTVLFGKGIVKDAHREASRDDNDVVRNDENGKAYYPAPIFVLKKPRPWDLPKASVSSTRETNVTISTQKNFIQEAAISQVSTARHANSMFQEKTEKFLLGYIRDNSTEDRKLLEQSLRSRGLGNEFFGASPAGENQPNETHFNPTGTLLTCQRNILCRGVPDRSSSGETSEYLLYYGDTFIARTFHKKTGYNRDGWLIRTEICVTVDKDALNSLPSNLMAVPPIPGIQLRIAEKLNQYRASSIDFVQACEKLVAVVAPLSEEKDTPLQTKEVLDLMSKIEDLIDDPSGYKAFLHAAKGYQTIAGGKISAYMLLVAGWAMKIAGMAINMISIGCRSDEEYRGDNGYRGDALIRLANEKIEQIEAVEELADASKTLSSFKR